MIRKWTAGLVLGLCSAAAAAATPTPEEMWAIIQQQQAEIAALKQQLASTDEEIKDDWLFKSWNELCNCISKGLYSI